MASFLVHDSLSQKANTVSYLYVKLKGVTSSGRRTRPACNLGHSRDFFSLNTKNMVFFTLLLCVLFFSCTSGRALFPPSSGTWGPGSRDAFLAL